MINEIELLIQTWLPKLRAEHKAEELSTDLIMRSELWWFGNRMHQDFSSTERPPTCAFSRPIFQQKWSWSSKHSWCLWIQKMKDLSASDLFDNILVLHPQIIKDYQLVLIVLILLLIDVLILAIWFSIDPLRLHRKRLESEVSFGVFWGSEMQNETKYSNKNFWCYDIWTSKVRSNTWRDSHWAVEPLLGIKQKLSFLL